MSKTTPKTRLLISSGNGPAECRIAVSKIANRIEREAVGASVSCKVSCSESSDKHGLASVLITLKGHGAEEIAKRWTGTIKWVWRSTIRPNHKRQNWFVGVHSLCADEQTRFSVNQSDLKFETFRAGGPGGQHQNTTDSAVRVIHTPSQISAVSRSQRSQHRNKLEAVKLLREKLASIQTTKDLAADYANAQLHRELERGNPVLVFKGERFREIK